MDILRIIQLFGVTLIFWIVYNYLRQENFKNMKTRDIQELAFVNGITKKYYKDSMKVYLFDKLLFTVTDEPKVIYLEKIIDNKYYLMDKKPGEYLVKVSGIILKDKSRDLEIEHSKKIKRIIKK